jgi:hypothetical protein
MRDLLYRYTSEEGLKGILEMTTFVFLELQAI